MTILPVDDRISTHSPVKVWPAKNSEQSISSSDSTQQVGVEVGSVRIRNLKQQFDEHKRAFSFPRFVDVGVDSSQTTCKTVDTAALYQTVLMAREPNNRDQPGTKQAYHTMYFGSEGGHRVHQYLHKLDQLLLDLAKVSSGGDEDVKARGGVVMGEVVQEINIVDQWKTMICEMASIQEGA